MNTDELSLCGCISADAGYYAVPLSSERDRNNTQTINIVNYMCHLDSGRIARVNVVNGTATRIYY